MRIILNRNEDWKSYDWKEIVHKIPDEEWGQRPFVADNRVLYCLTRDNRPSYLMEADFEAGPIVDARLPVPLWQVIADLNEVARYLVKEGFTSALPGWLINYARRGYKKEE